VIADRLLREFRVEANIGQPQVAYKEAIGRTARAEGRFIKQTGGHGQFGVANIEVEPLPRGSGFEYQDKIFGGAIPHQFIGSVEKGVVKAMQEGALSGNPMVDVRVTLVDGKFHTVDSSDMAFQIAGSLALKDAAQQAGVVLLEPIVELEIVVPDDHTGDVMGDLNSKRAKIQGVDSAGAGKQRIKTLVPQAEVARYAIDLRSLTGGRGAFSMKFSHYEEVPTHLADRLIAEAQKAKDEAKK
jgi:elongation factor G